MSDFRTHVYVIGEYVPVSSGTEEAQREVGFFKQLFFNANMKLGAMTYFERALTSKLVERMKAGDVVVLLNPAVDQLTNSFSSLYRKLIGCLPGRIGKGRIVVAFQDRDVKKKLCLGSLPFLGQHWEISYVPLHSTSAFGLDNISHPSPAPEEAIGIVKKIINGENPDVYA